MFRYSVVLATLAVTPHLACCRPAVAQVSSAAPKAVRRPVRGKAVDANGRPVPGVMLYFQLNYAGAPDPRNIVATDAQGNFVWQPEAGSFPYAESATGMDVQVSSIRSGWKITSTRNLVNDFQKSQWRTELQNTLALAPARWQGNPGYVNGQIGPDKGTLLVSVPPSATVKLRPRGPEGQAYPNRRVQLWPKDDWGQGSDPYFWEERTDQNGDVSLPLFPAKLGYAQPKPFRVVLPGIGYATSDKYALQTGKTVIAALPPLAPLIAVPGRIAPALRKPGQVVRLGRAGDWIADAPWAQRQVSVRPDGSFTLPDVIAGDHLVYLFDSASDAAKDDGRSVRRAYQTFSVTGGVAPPRVSLVPPPPSSPSSLPAVQNVTAVLRGRILNPDGSPAPGVDVWAQYSRYGIREQVYTLRARTDISGAYALPDIDYSVGGLSGSRGSVTLIATRDGDAPTLAHVSVSAADVSAPDLAFSRSSGTLTVTVQDSDGKPQPGASVEAQADVYGIPVRYGVRHEGTGADELRRALVPRAVTDANGVARFAGLRPDRYEVRAVYTPIKPSDPARRGSKIAERFGNPASNVPAVRVQGIAVSAGEETARLVRLETPPAPVRLRYLLPNGTPLKPEDRYLIAVSSSVGAQQGGYVIPSRATAAGVLESAFPPGVWLVAPRLQVAPPHSFANEPPFLIGQTTIAVTSRRPHDGVVDIALVRRDPARLRLQVEDEHGQPVAGLIYTTGYSSFPGQAQEVAGTSNRQGHLTLTPTRGETVSLRAEAIGDKPLPQLEDGQRFHGFPDESLLLGRRRWPVVEEPLDPGRDASVTLRAGRVGWVRGKVASRPPWLQVQDNDFRHGLRWGTGSHYNAQTGEYLIGPLPVGRQTLSFGNDGGGKQENVIVSDRHVTRRDVLLDPALGDHGQREEARGLLLNKARVTIVDKEGLPVPGAHVFFQRRDGYPSLTRLTNDRGEAYPAPISPIDPWNNSPWEQGDQAPPLPRPAAPVWIAWVPGTWGFYASEPVAPGREAEPVHITLGSALSLSGRITVGGEPLVGVPGQVTIYAKAAGIRGDMAVQPLPDGTFILRGLTPGKYQVQASLDNTYFSDVQTITADEGALLLPLDLALPSPGAPLVLVLGPSAALSRVTPTAKAVGPLAEKYAPRAWATDGKGLVRVEGLPVGKHRLRLPNGKTTEVSIAPETQGSGKAKQ